MGTPHDYCPINAQVIEYRVGALEEAIKQISLAVKIIAENTSQIASLEQRHAETREGLERAFNAVAKSDERHEKLSGRVMEIEKAMPSIKESSRWIRLGVISLVGLVLVSAFKAVFKF